MNDVALSEFSGTSARRDELWKHTCFEAFVGGGARGAYHEINLAPSADWAAYTFEGYRAGMSEALIEAWSWERLGDSRSLVLTADIDLRRADVDKDRAWRLALSAVIEDIKGDKTYWALAHPSHKPDFHHPDSFTLVLPAPEPAGNEMP